MKHGRKRKIRPTSAKHVHLVQFRIQAVAPVPCQAVSHHPQTDGESDVSWDVRVYQNIDRLTDLLVQGVEDDRANQILWDEACREQDTIGVRMHATYHLCETCLFGSFENHAGHTPLLLATLVARLTGGAFLMVADRQTEAAGIISPFAVNIPERDMLKTLRDASTSPIGLRGTPEA